MLTRAVDGEGQYRQLSIAYIQGHAVQRLKLASWQDLQRQYRRYRPPPTAPALAAAARP